MHIGGPGYSDDTVSDTIRSIERVVDLARQGSLGSLGDRVYLLIKFDHDALWWRSQILAAQWSGPRAVNEIWKNYATGTIALTRRYFWETERMQAVEITSGTTTTATTGYATVYNSDDAHATQRNWFQIAAAQVIGSLPAPAKISIKNTSGATRGATSFFLGNYVFTNPAANDPIFRDDEATFSDTTPAIGDEHWISAWNIATSNIVDDFKGQFGRFVVAWTTTPNISTLVRAAINYNSLFDMALGEQVLGSPQMFVQDLGALPIPPSQWSDGMGTNLKFILKAKATAADTIDVNWLQIFPSGQGRYRVLHGLIPLSFGSNDELIDDGPNGTVYAIDAILGGAKVPLYRPMYEPIHLWPNVAQRFRLIVSGGGSFEAGQPWGVSVSYRPRRLTL